MIKTYRGKLEDGDQAQIRLSTPQGKIGYKIKKFELMPPSPGAAGQESVVKIFRREQTAVDGLVDFDDSTLLAAAFGSTMTGEPSVHPQTLSVIFDSAIINQDIFVTHSEVNGSVACNYYVELEQVKLTEEEALVEIVKNLRAQP